MADYVTDAGVCLELIHLIEMRAPALPSDSMVRDSLMEAVPVLRSTVERLMRLDRSAA